MKSNNLSSPLLPCEYFIRSLKDANLDWKKALDAMQGPAVLENVKRDIADHKQMGISKTPTFFVNGKPLVEFGYEQLRSLVKAEINNVY